MVDLSKQQLSSVGPRAYVENFYPILVPDTRQGPCLTWKSKWVSNYVLSYAVMLFLG